MAKEVIAIDIDDVLAINVPAFLEFSNKRWGTKLTMEDYSEDWPTMWQIDRSALRKRIQVLDNERIVAAFAPDSDATAILQRLKKNYKLVITTSRRKELIRDTVDWIGRHFPGTFQEIHHTGLFDGLHNDAHLATKAELCRQIGADYLIDDQPKHCYAAADAGIPALLFGHYPWNRSPLEHKNVTPVASWPGVAEYFNV